MSDNSVIYLEKTIKGYEITHKDFDGEDDDYSHYIRATLKQAIKKAKDLQDENNPEYGIFIGEL